MAKSITLGDHMRVNVHMLPIITPIQLYKILVFQIFYSLVETQGLHQSKNSR